MDIVYDSQFTHKVRKSPPSKDFPNSPLIKSLRPPVPWICLTVSSTPVRSVPVVTGPDTWTCGSTTKTKTVIKHYITTASFKKGRRTRNKGVDLLPDLEISRCLDTSDLGLRTVAPNPRYITLVHICSRNLW